MAQALLLKQARQGSSSAVFSLPRSNTYGCVQCHRVRYLGTRSCTVRYTTLYYPTDAFSYGPSIIGCYHIVWGVVRMEKLPPAYDVVRAEVRPYWNLSDGYISGLSSCCLRIGALSRSSVNAREELGTSGLFRR